MFIDVLQMTDNEKTITYKRLLLKDYSLNDTDGLQYQDHARYWFKIWFVP